MLQDRLQQDVGGLPLARRDPQFLKTAKPRLQLQGREGLQLTTANVGKDVFLDQGTVGRQRRRAAPRWGTNGKRKRRYLYPTAPA